MSKDTASVRSKQVERILKHTKGLSSFWERPLSDWDETMFVIESDFKDERDALNGLRQQYVLLRDMLTINCPEQDVVKSRLGKWKV